MGVKALLQLLTDFAREKPVIFFYLMLMILLFILVLGWMFIALSPTL